MKILFIIFLFLIFQGYYIIFIGMNLFHKLTKVVFKF